MNYILFYCEKDYCPHHKIFVDIEEVLEFLNSHPLLEKQVGWDKDRYEKSGLENMHFTDLYKLLLDGEFMVYELGADKFKIVTKEVHWDYVLDDED